MRKRPGSARTRPTASAAAGCSSGTTARLPTGRSPARRRGQPGLAASAPGPGALHPVHLRAGGQPPALVVAGVQLLERGPTLLVECGDACEQRLEADVPLAVGRAARALVVPP